jgi:hypothetical protein
VKNIPNQPEGRGHGAAQGSCLWNRNYQFNQCHSAINAVTKKFDFLSGNGPDMPKDREVAKIYGQPLLTDEYSALKTALQRKAAPRGWPMQPMGRIAAC